MASAAAVLRPSAVNLADELKIQRAGISRRDFFPIGYMLRLQLGIDAQSAYFESQKLTEKIASISRVQGLALDWNQTNYPLIAELRSPTGGRSETFVFPNGVAAPPKIADPRITRLAASDPKVPMLSQNMEDYASGKIVGRDGTTFIVLQPIEQIAVRIASTIVILRGFPGPRNGTRPALLYSERKREGYIVGGRVDFS